MSNALNLPIPVPVNKGGTGTGSQITTGVNYYDGTNITSGSIFTFDGSNVVALVNGSATPVTIQAINITGEGGFVVKRGTTLYQAGLTYGTISTGNDWFSGLYPITSGHEFAIRNLTTSSTALSIDDATNNLAVYSLSASRIVGTNANKELSSVNLTGDVTTSGGFATTLATVNSNVGTFGDATHVGSFTINAKGLITAASSILISGVAPGGSAGGDLTGTYPNPTIATVNSNVGTFGNSGQVAAFQVNAKGQITAVSNINISIAGSAVSGSALTTSNDTNITLTTGGSASTSLLRAASITAGWTGTLAETRGGTNQSTYATGDILYASASNTLSKLSGNTTATKQYLSQTGTGTASQAPSWSAIAGSDITGAALTKTDDTNVTLTLGGNPTTALLRAASLTLGWTGTLGISRGGTNQSSFTSPSGGLNPVIIYNGTSFTSAAARFGYDTTNDILKIVGSAANPQFAVSTSVTGSSNSSSTLLSRGDDANGGNYNYYQTGNVTYWQNGMFSTASALTSSSKDFVFYAPTGGSSLGAGLILALAQSTGDVTVSTGNLLVGTSGKTLQFPNADADKILFYSSTNRTKIDTSTGYNLNFRVGDTASASSGIFNWYTVNGSSAFAKIMSLSNTGVLNLPQLTATGIVTTDGSSNLTTVASPSTYTPTIGDGTNNFTMTAQTGQYYKIGSLYFVSIRIVWSGKGSAVSGSSVAVSLPVAIGSNQARAPAVIGYASGVGFTGTTVVCTGNSGASNLFFTGLSNAGAVNTATVGQFGTSGEVQIFITYWSN